jgi:hypothetical protein
MRRLIAGAASAALLSGCGGIAAKVNARNEMEASKGAYKACLAQHSQDVASCEAARLTFEADMKAYRATSAGILPGTNSTINVNPEQ